MFYCLYLCDGNTGASSSVGCWYKVLEVWCRTAETGRGASCTCIVIGAVGAFVGEKCGLCMTRGVLEIG
jgi:hypothetical protein